MVSMHLLLGPRANNKEILKRNRTWNHSNRLRASCWAPYVVFDAQFSSHSLVLFRVALHITVFLFEIGIEVTFLVA